MSDGTIAAASGPIRDWLNGPATDSFETMRGEVIGVCNKIKALTYKGPNAVAVETNTETSMQSLGTDSREFMVAAAQMIGAAAGVILGAGGHADMAGEFDDAFAPDQFNIPAGSFMNAEDFSLNPTQFRETISTIETSFGSVQDSARQLVTSLQNVDPVAWQGQARQAVEAKFEEAIGTGELAVTPDALLLPNGAPVANDGQTPSSLVDAFAIHMSAIINTLYAQLNSAEKADQETASQISSV